MRSASLRIPHSCSGMNICACDTFTASGEVPEGSCLTFEERIAKQQSVLQAVLRFQLLTTRSNDLTLGDVLLDLFILRGNLISELMFRAGVRFVKAKRWIWCLGSVCLWCCSDLGDGGAFTVMLKPDIQNGGKNHLSFVSSRTANVGDNCSSTVYPCQQQLGDHRSGF